MIRSAIGKVIWVERATMFYAVVLAVIVALVVVAAVSTTTKPAEAAFPGKNGRLAFVHDGEIYTIRSNGTGLKKLTSNSLLDTQPAWSPNGRKIAFARGVAGSDFEIHTMNSDGTGKKKITNNAVDDLEPAWSPNGKRIVFRRGPVDGPDDIFTMRASDGKGVKRVTNNINNTFGPDWSPNGNKIAYLGWDADVHLQIFTIAPDGSGQQQLTNNNVSKYSLTWSPDGTKIAYYDSQGFHVMNENGGNKQSINPSTPFFRHPAWSPDGEKIAYQGTQPIPKIHTMNASDGSGAQKISDHPATEVAWQPNTAPVIKDLAPSPGSETLDKTPTIGATVRDKQTNLAKGNISLLLDGQNIPKAEFSYNRKTDRLSFTPDTNLSIGDHTAKIVATDDALLAKSRTWHFQVKGPVIVTGYL